MNAPAANLEFGLGGDLGGDIGIGTNPPFAQWLKALAAEVRRRDPLARIDFLEGAWGIENAAIAAAEGMPFRQFTDLYVIGGHREGRAEDALVTLQKHLDTATAMKTVTALNMQVWAIGDEPSDDQLCAFYHAAEQLAAPYGIPLFTETHVDRFTYDPRRLLRIHARLLRESSGRYGLRVGADFSHYVHQLGNPTVATSADIRSGALRIDPHDPGNLISTQIIQGGLIGYGHLRCAVPNQRDRDQGSIQYPLVDPASDPWQPWSGELAASGRYDTTRTAAWREFYRQTFAYQLSHPERPMARFSSEFIGGDDHNDYRVEGYSNLHQNLAVLVWAQALARELRASRTATAGAGTG